MARALAERDRAMEQRATTLAAKAVETGAAWVDRLGPSPADPTLVPAWLAQVQVVAAYRDRWAITGPTPVDRPDQARTTEQLGHQKRAQAATQLALAISRQVAERPEPATVGIPSRNAEHRGVER